MLLSSCGMQQVVGDQTRLGGHRDSAVDNTAFGPNQESTYSAVHISLQEFLLLPPPGSFWPPAPVSRKLLEINLHIRADY